MPSEITALEFDVKRLVGKSVRLMPYARGYCPRDMLYQLWKAMDSDQLTDYVFHSFNGPQTPYSQRGDLVEFVKMFEPDHGYRILLIVLDATVDKLAGAIWFDEIVEKQRASISIFMLTGYRGEPAIEAVRMALDYMFTAFDMKAIWAFTPWLHAVNLAKNTGFIQQAKLAELAKDKEMTILRINKEDFYGTRL